MQILLNSIDIKNFKGIKDFSAQFSPTRTNITAENGVGKTSIYDAFLFLFFGKDSTGRKEFEIRPLDEANQPIKGLVVAVEAAITIDGVVHILHKEHHEKVIKEQLRGYETLCWIDEVPKKVSEFQAYITDIIEEDNFKVLTNLRQFSEIIDWKTRRALLLDIAGEIGTPDGFEDLLGNLNGREIDEYKQVLLSQKKRYEKDRNEINPRIDELQRGLENYAGSDINEAELKQRRETLQAEIDKLDEERRDLNATEQTRQRLIETRNGFEAQKKQREIELKAASTFKLTEQKQGIEKDVSDKKLAVTQAQSAVSMKKSEIISAQSNLDVCTNGLNNIREQYTKLSDAPCDTTCYACGRELPEAKANELKKERQRKLDELTQQGNKAKADVKTHKKNLEKLQAELQPLQTNLENAKIDLENIEEIKRVRFPELDKQIAENTPPPFEEDEAWAKIDSDIQEVNARIGEPVSEQLAAIEKNRTAKTTKLNEINTTLSQADQIEKSKKRIEELGEQEKDLAQKVANTEKELAEIGRYTEAESNLIENMVNSKFKHTKFKLFKQQLNEGIKPCCEAVLDGVPYPDMSAGQQILIGIDIVNVLSAHYDMSVPLFIDHAESLTFPIESASQTITLYAQKGVRKLVVETSNNNSEEGDLSHGSKSKTGERKPATASKK